MANEVGWLLEKDGLCLGIGNDDSGVHWIPFTLPNALRFARREDALRFQRLLIRVRKKLRVCPSDVGDAAAIEHVWCDGPAVESREVSEK